MRLNTWGSKAASLIVVFHFLLAAHIMRLFVAVTAKYAWSSTSSVLGVQLTLRVLFSIMKSYPIPIYPSTCSFIGRFQILSHWGNGMLASPKWVKSPAIKYILARVRDTFSTLIFLRERWELSIVRVCFLKVTILPRLSRKWMKSWTSSISGTFVNVLFHFTSRLAAMSGSVAFLLPEIVTLHLSFFHHCITNKFSYLRYKIFAVSL